jgi:Protein of unknown function (DUF2442)
MLATHTIEEVSFLKDMLILKIDGRVISLNLDKLSSKLLAATDMQRSFYKVSPSGYGIHWPLIDEDLSVESILKQC